MSPHPSANRKRDSAECFSQRCPVSGFPSEPKIVLRSWAPTSRLIRACPISTRPWKVTTAWLCLLVPHNYLYWCSLRASLSSRRTGEKRKTPSDSFRRFAAHLPFGQPETGWHYPLLLAARWPQNCSSILMSRLCLTAFHPRLLQPEEERKAPGQLRSPDRDPSHPSAKRKKG
jgi:hypothetical protein